MRRNPLSRKIPARNDEIECPAVDQTLLVLVKARSVSAFFSDIELGFTSFVPSALTLLEDEASSSNSSFLLLPRNGLAKTSA